MKQSTLSLSMRRSRSCLICLVVIVALGLIIMTAKPIHQIVSSEYTVPLKFSQIPFSSTIAKTINNIKDAITLKARFPRKESLFILDNVTTVQPDKKAEKFLIAWYNMPPWWMWERGNVIDMCEEPRCHVSADSKLVDQADAVIVNAVDLPFNSKPSGNPKQFWVFMGIEAPIHYHTHTYQKPEWIGRFNWTMTYRVDSDIFAPSSKLIYVPNPHPVNLTAIALGKTKPVTWFVSNCSPPSQRQTYVQRMQKHINVDIYGNCGPLKVDNNNKKAWHDLLDFKYKFYLAFENSFCFDYVTEKLFKTYESYVVPVVRGATDYAKYFPDGTFINAADFKTPEDLAKHLNYLDKNITAYTEILERKNNYRNARMMSSKYSQLCDLCKKLHNKPERKTYSNIHQYLTMSGKACHAPTDL